MRRRAARVVLAALGAVVLAGSADPASAAPKHGTGLKLASRTQVDSRLVQLNFRTPAIAGGTGARVLLPPGYDATERAYPVLYLYHGAGYDETSWSGEGDVENIVGDRKVIVVMPRGGGNGYYANWYNGGDFGSPAYETFHVRQLIPWIDGHFRTVANRGGRITAGFSMGGFGAMSYAARHPDMFSGAFSFSGAIDTNYPPFQPIGEASSVADGGQYAAIFGQRQTQEVRWRARNPWDLAPNLAGMTLQLRTGDGKGGGDFGGPPLDPIEFGVHEMAISMDARLTALGFDHLFEDYGPGAHQFPYYRRDLTEAMPSIMATFRHPPTPPRKFTFRAVEPRYSAYGFRVKLMRPQLEFSELHGNRVTGRSFRLAGSGTAAVRTPRAFNPGDVYRVASKVDGERSHRMVTADHRGALHLRVSLGEPNQFQQYTADSNAAGGPVVHHAAVRIRRAVPVPRPPR